jgi:hypothetical protein
MWRERVGPHHSAEYDAFGVVESPTHELFLRQAEH